MRVLVLGGTGMLGHKVVQIFSERFETYATVRSFPPGKESVFKRARVLDGVSAEDIDSVVTSIVRARPHVVVNCIGIVKQAREAADERMSISINSLFPHRLASIAEAAGCRLVHVSTDCVFSGERGRYSEHDMPDPVDLYGRTKLLGEVDRPHTLTVRTSMIGRELAGSHGLLEWFLAQRGGSVRGFTRAIFSGLTTSELARHLARIVAEHPSLEGVLHLAAPSISKHDLLLRTRDALGVDLGIEPDDAFFCDRSLDDARFREATGIPTPLWEGMLDELAADDTPYDTIRAREAVNVSR